MSAKFPRGGGAGPFLARSLNSVFASTIKGEQIKKIHNMWLISLFVCFDSLRPINNLQLNRDGSSWVEPVLS